MKQHAESRRQFLKVTGMAAGVLLLPSGVSASEAHDKAGSDPFGPQSGETAAADYTIRIAVTPIVHQAHWRGRPQFGGDEDAGIANMHQTCTREQPAAARGRSIIM